MLVHGDRIRFIHLEGKGNGQRLVSIFCFTMSLIYLSNQHPLNEVVYFLRDIWTAYCGMYTYSQLNWGRQDCGTFILGSVALFCL